ncbi:ATP-dependent helicase [Crassaminicella indica]|uniref:DNA 3'-5' helicase n=1 Tax=Crassaminicella indica TaxID=2855394 RepID=A0ABX8RDQ0_9CLOT|nr:ATP-dependent helicase [Crassaminicella indica]QXM06549.1 ATP-dependent helicase [Crassaminicella indica]
MLRNSIGKNINIQLNPQQEKIANHIDGPALCLACPGSGKTTTLLIRTYNLIANRGIPANKILSMTFSRAAAKDMESRFKKFFGSHIKINFSTIHAFAYRVLRQVYSKIYSNDFQLIELDGKKISILKNIYQHFNKSFINDDKLEELETSISFIKNLCIPVENYKDYHIKIPNFLEIFYAYESYKKRNYFIDFDDMLTLTLDIFKTYPKVLNYYQNKYSYIQIDEAQDTSKVQHEIIKLLAKKHNNIFMVCDDDQSLYRFRGADPSFLTKECHQIWSNIKIYFMEQNYRSTKNIVSISNKCIIHNKNRYPKKMFTNNLSKRSVKVVHVNSSQEQIEYVIKQIKGLENYNDTAILFYKNISAIPFIDGLNRNGIKFYMRDHRNSFFRNFAVRDIINFFKVAINPSDMNSFYDIYHKTNAFISKKMIEHALKNIKKDIFDSLLSYPALNPKQKSRIRDLKGKFLILATKTPDEAIHYIKNAMGYEKRLADYCEKFGYNLTNIHHILDTLSYIGSKTSKLYTFIDRLTQIEDIMHQAQYNKNDNAITLSTLHSSKGLEFKNVFLIDIIEGQLPSQFAIDQAEEEGFFDDLEEERRLFYVGMTRAKEYLDIITFKHIPSRFINEILNSEYNKKLFVGSKVHHPLFGQGYIKKITDSTITIKFDKAGIKQLDKQIIINKNLLKLC